MKIFLVGLLYVYFFRAGTTSSRRICLSNFCGMTMQEYYIIQGLHNANKIHTAVWNYYYYNKKNTETFRLSK